MQKNKLSILRQEKKEKRLYYDKKALFNRSYRHFVDPWHNAGCGSATYAAKPEKQGIKIGVCAYKMQDTFILNMVKSLSRQAKQFTAETGENLIVDISDSEESQRLQNEQVKRYIDLNYDVICVNLVDRTNTSTIIDAAIEAGIPLVFFNREPVNADILRADNIYYVGSDAKQSAILQGQMIIDCWLKEKEKIDKNNNNTIDYVMLEGESGHQDATIRTKWSVETVENYGIRLKKQKGAAANWDRSQAAALVEAWYKEIGDEMEFVICNNDDMALGALDAFDKLNVPPVPVVGVDATNDGILAIKEGELLGTVDCNFEKHAEVIFKLAYSLAKTGTPPQDVELLDDRYVRIPLKSITMASFAEK
ncbi:MAG: galactose ABC transporter substrate-binding protein [Oscillospiraceae bacterium]